MGAFCARTPERRPRLAADGASADGVRSQRRHTSVRAGGGFPPAANKDDIPHAAPRERLCQRGTKAVHLRSCRERFADGEQRRRHTSVRARGGLPSAWNKDDIPHAAPGERLCQRGTKAAYLRPRRGSAFASGEQKRQRASCRAGGSAFAGGEQRRCTSGRAGSALPMANKGGIPPAAPGGGSCQRGTKTAARLMPCRGVLPPAANKGGAPPIAPGEGSCQRGTNSAAYLRPRRERAPVSGEQRRHTSCRAGGAPLPAANKGGIPPSAPGERLCQRGTKTAARLMPRRGSAFASGEQKRRRDA